MTMTAANPTAHETLRKADLDTLAKLLQSQQMRSHDLAVTGHRLVARGGNLVVSGVDVFQDVTSSGVTRVDVNGTYALGDVGTDSLGTRLKLPQQFLRDHRTAHPDLFDEVVNYHLGGTLNGQPSPHSGPDTRIHTVRLLTADDPATSEVTGMIRAVLGGRYQALDSIDALIKITEGLAQAGITPDRCKFEADLTESRMVLKVWVPEISVLAPALLGNYTSPFTGQTGNDLPRVFAGLVFSNSEVGKGAWAVTPRVVFEVCGNGQTIAKDAFTKPHVGSRHDDSGVIKWSTETQRLLLDTVRSQTADAVRTFLDIDYVTAQIAKMQETAGVKIEDHPDRVIAEVTRRTNLTNVRGTVLEMFMRGADLTAGGVMNAFTAAAQVVTSANTAYELESKAIQAMEYAASNR